MPIFVAVAAARTSAVGRITDIFPALKGRKGAAFGAPVDASDLPAASAGLRNTDGAPEAVPSRLVGTLFPLVVFVPSPFGAGGLLAMFDVESVLYIGLIL